MTNRPSPPAAVLPDPSRDHCRGPGSARLSLVEYGDFESSSCADAHWVVKELAEELGDELCVVFRHFPLTQDHPRAQAAAEAAEAADEQGKFWLMHDRLFEHQDHLDREHLETYAREISLDMVTFERDLRSDAPARRVAEDVASARKHQVHDAPAFFLNGTLYAGPREFLPMLAALQGSDTQHGRFDK
jgi:formate-nitrite transporter family protein